jgi:methyltransferase-like protein/trans-aconitate methyltransferase
VATDSSSYDQVPYISLAFPQTYPDHLATVARIFGLSPARVSACRVLELGCASGGNLIPMAVNLPGSEFVGVDFSQHQVDEAQVAIRALGLRNIRIEAASILDVDRSWGAFDYILCHGVFSWVEPAVQDRILQIAGEQLTADGVAYVSYNTYPGWHMRQLVRDMMRYHAGQFAAAEEQVSQARALLSFLASASQGSGPYGQLLAAEAERAARASDSYLFHEHLERTNLPIYFHQFVERAERAGLQYLSEAVVSEMLTTLLPPPVAETLERISPDILHLEQYLDFVRNRQFRQTLLCRDSAHPRRALTAETLHGLLISSAATTDAPDIAFDDSTVVTFTNGRQRADLTRPATKAAFAALTDAWPRAIAVDELCETALERVAAHLTDTSVDDARQAMLEDLFGGVMYGLIESHTEPPSCTNRLADMPRAHPVAALQAESGAIVVNAHHQMLELDPLCREVLRLADGRRRLAEMLDALEGSAAAGSEESDEGRTAGADVAAARERLAARLEQALATLLRSAVFVE